MARGKQQRQMQLQADQGFFARDRYKVAPPEVVPDVGNEAHRRSLEVYARATVGRRDITVSFGPGGSHTDMKGNIQVASDLPPNGSNGERYVCMSGFLSHELWHERVTARVVWEEFLAEMETEQERLTKESVRIRTGLSKIAGYQEMAAIEGEAKRAAELAVVLEHALIPGLQADLAKLSAGSTKKRRALEEAIAEAEEQLAEVHKAAKSLSAQAAKLRAPIDAAAAPLERQGIDMLQEMHKLTAERKDIWNIVEDGRIEEYARETQPLEYRRISLLNRIYPRINAEYTAEKPAAPKAPEGYVPTDIDGNPLPIVTDATGQDRVVLLPGTKLPVFGDAPLDPTRQIRAALLAEAVPEFSGADKPMHPRVRACFDECLPLIAEGVTTDTRGCLAASDAILEVLERHDLLPKIDPDGGGGGGGGGGGMPSPFPGKGAAGASSDEQRGDGGGEGEGTSDASGNAAEGEDGGMSSGQREKNEKDGKGSASDDEAKAAVEKGEGEAKANKAKADGQNRADDKNGDIPAERWQAPGRQDITSQGQIRAAGENRFEAGHLAAYGNQLADELADLKVLARGPQRYLRSGRIDRRLLSKARIETRDNDDARPRVFYRPGEELDVDLVFDLVTDMSGSMDHYRGQLGDAAITTHIAGKKLEIPHAIWGFDSGGSEANHYEFKGYDDARPHALAEIGRRTNSAVRAGGGTPTRAAIEFQMARMARRRETTRVAVIFTDGGPTDSTPEECRRIIDQGRARGITVVGCYFRDPSDRYASQGSEGMRSMFGKDYIEIERVGELPRQLGKLLQTLMKSKVRRAGG